MVLKTEIYNGLKVICPKENISYYIIEKEIHIQVSHVKFPKYQF